MSRKRNNRHPVDGAIGRAVMKLRGVNGMSREDVADRLGLDDDVLKRVESGERPLLASELLWILEILKTPLSELSLHLSDEEADD